VKLLRVQLTQDPAWLDPEVVVAEVDVEVDVAEVVDPVEVVVLDPVVLVLLHQESYRRHLQAM